MERKTVQLAKIKNNGIWTVVLDRSETHNKFKVYRKYDGRRKLMIKYGDYRSALLYIINYR